MLWGWSLVGTMPARKLTSAFCESVSPTGGRQVAYPDNDVRGLELRVSGDGRKTWSYRYWTKLGRRGRVTLGTHSREFGLSDARAAARKAQVVVDDGGDPGMARRVAKVEAATAGPISPFCSAPPPIATAKRRRDARATEVLERREVRSCRPSPESQKCRTRLAASGARARRPTAAA